MTAPLSMGLSTAGTMINAFGQKAQGEATSRMYSYQSGVAQVRSRMARENRDYSLGVGEKELLSLGLASRARMGKIRAAQAASGIDIGSGTPAKVQESQETIASLDLATLRDNIARRAYGYEVEEWEADKQAGLYSMAGANAKRAGKIGALGSLISGAANVSSKWTQGTAAGLWNTKRPLDLSAPYYPNFEPV